MEAERSLDHGWRLSQEAYMLLDRPNRASIAYCYRGSTLSMCLFYPASRGTSRKRTLCVYVFEACPWHDSRMSPAVGHMSLPLTLFCHVSLSGTAHISRISTEDAPAPGYASGTAQAIHRTSHTCTRQISADAVPMLTCTSLRLPSGPR